VLAYLGKSPCDPANFRPVWVFFVLVALGRLPSAPGRSLPGRPDPAGSRHRCFAGYLQVGTVEWSFFLYDAMKRQLLVAVPLGFSTWLHRRMSELCFDVAPGLRYLVEG